MAARLRCRGRPHAMFYQAAFLRPLGGGTLAPLRRASERPMAIACFRLFTFRPLPDFSLPRLNSCISLFTLCPALGLYLRLREEEEELRWDLLELLELLERLRPDAERELRLVERCEPLELPLRDEARGFLERELFARDLEEVERELELLDR